MNKDLLNELEKNNFISTKRAVELGVSKTLLSNYVNEGKLDRVDHGIYVLPNCIYDDMTGLMLKSKNIIFSHETALFLHGLSDRTPFIHSVTIPSDASLSKECYKECKCYYVKRNMHELGLIQICNIFGHKVKCYDIERTICDIVKDKNRMDEEIVFNAIKRYSKLESKNLNKLYKYAVLLKVNDKLRTYFEFCYEQ